MFVDLYISHHFFSGLLEYIFVSQVSVFMVPKMNKENISRFLY